jgi:hypothetical protein
MTGTMAVRADRHHIVDCICSTVRQGFDVMYLKVRVAVLVEKRSGRSAEFAIAFSIFENPRFDRRVAFELNAVASHTLRALSTDRGSRSPFLPQPGYFRFKFG